MEWKKIRQDGNMAVDNHWYAYDYDDYGRVISEGFAVDSLSSIMDTLITNTYGTTGAEKGKLKTASQTILNNPNDVTLQQEYIYDACGRNTLIKSNSILHPTPGSIVDSLILDSRDMAIESYQKVIPDGLTIKRRQTYDHAGREKKSYIQITTVEQTWPEQELSEKNYTVKEQISALKLGGTLQEVNYGYLPNRLLKSINTSLSPFWTDINNTDLFGMDLQYDLDNVDSNIKNDILKKNGNISGIQWTTRNPDGSTLKKQSFGLKYNWLNMLTDATYSKEYDNSGAYNVNVVYDNLRGSFNNIQRKSQGTQIDNMSYSYVGGTNKIDKITDSATGNVSKGYKAKSNDSYVYDPNGSIIYDPSRKTSLIRNHLLLVERVEIPDSNSMIMFYYDASGALHREESIVDSTIVIIKDYIGSIEYINGSPHIIQHENGYILLDRGLSEEHLLLIGVESGDSTYESVSTISKRTINNPDSIEYRAEEFIVLTNGFEVNLGADFAALIDTFPIMDLAYRYHIYDHLGNMRVEFKDNGMGKGVTTSQHHYYPFGAEMEGSWQQTNEVSQQSYMRLGGNRITYFDMDFDLHAFRDYDPWTGRWHGPDMLSDVAPGWSPYRYAFNNPVNYIDPLGLFESRAEAKRYRRDNDLDGRIRKNKETGRFEIRFNDSDGVITQTSEGNIDYSVSASYTGSAIRPHEKKSIEEFRDYNILTRYIYNIANDASITLQSYNPLDTRIQHLSGDFIANRTEKQAAFTNTAANFLPHVRGLNSIKSLLPASSILPRLNAAEFSKFFKGTFVARLAPATRGKLNRIMNYFGVTTSEVIEDGSLFLDSKSAYDAGKSPNK